METGSETPYFAGKREVESRERGVINEENGTLIKLMTRKRVTMK
jgi:hypothetical protein